MESKTPLGSGMHTSSLECDKQSDGRLDCTVYGVDFPAAGRGDIEEVRVIDVSSRSRHMGPEEDGHVEFIFQSYDDVMCQLNGDIIECE